MWYKLPGRGLFMLVWIVATLIIIYGPWGSNPEPGKFSWVAISSAVNLIVTPLLAIILSGGSKAQEKNVDQGKNLTL